MGSQTLSVDQLRTLDSSGISTAYAPLGGQFLHPMRLICIVNTTDVLLTFGFDGTTDNIVVPANGFKLLDLTTNRQENLTYFVFRVGTQFFVKGEPTLGAVYLEAYYGQGE